MIHEVNAEDVKTGDFLVFGHLAWRVVARHAGPHSVRLTLGGTSPLDYVYARRRKVEVIR